MFHVTSPTSDIPNTAREFGFQHLSSSQVRGGPLGPLHRNISKVSPFFFSLRRRLSSEGDTGQLSYHSSSCHPVPRELYMHLFSLRTTHDKTLEEALSAPSCTRPLRSRSSRSSAAKTPPHSPSLCYLICVSISFLFPLCFFSLLVTPY